MTDVSLRKNEEHSLKLRSRILSLVIFEETIKLEDFQD